MTATGPMSQAEIKWAATAGRLKKFVASHGRFPRQGEGDGLRPDLGAWLRNQRHSQTISATRARKLDELVPGWRGRNNSAAQRNKTWNAAASRLAAFVEKNGRLPGKLDSDGRRPEIGSWLINQRHSCSITPARVQKLDELVPGWRGNELR